MIKFITHNILFLFAIACTLYYKEAASQVNIQAGYGIYNLKAPGFQTFFSTYNSYFASDLSKPFKEDFDAASGLWWRAGYCIRPEGGGFYGNFVTGVSKFKTINTTTFKNNDQREVTLRVSDWSTDIILGVGSENFHLAPIGSFYLRSNQAYNGYIYNDGTKSYSTEKYLNGIFSASRLSMAYGAEVGFGVKQVNIIVRAVRSYKPTQKDGSTYLDYYKDLVDYKSFNASSANNPTEYFPADVAYFYQNQLQSEAENNIVYINDRGWQFSIGLQLNLTRNND